MRSLFIACAVAGAGLTTVARAPAQVLDTARAEVPAELAVRAAERWNRPAEIRQAEDLEIAPAEEVHGSVAVREGWVTVGGTVHGDVVVLNGNVTLRSGSRVDGDVIVVGGFVEGAERGSVGGTVTSHAGTMRYRLEEERVVVEGVEEVTSRDNWLRRWRRRHQLNSSRILISAGTYNRVEGLPINVGGALRQNFGWGRLSADALGIFRSLERFEWNDQNLGYSLSAEVQYGKLDALAAGLRMYEVVDGSERWQLRDAEVGLASFFFRRDFRDYYEREGATGYLTLRDGSRATFTIAYGNEHWGTRSSGDPFSLFRNGESWRPNPVMDEGRFRLTTATLTYDTRNDRARPRSGWLLSGEVEHGESDRVFLGPTSPVARPAGAGAVDLEYTRVFFDLRRYNRLSPTRQLNARLVLGGWVDGDQLPLERRFSLGGPGTIPGYDFRRTESGEADVLQCSDGPQLPGRPGQCERMVLAQLEYRADFRLPFGNRGDLREFGFHRSPAWVVFVDAGRGWLVGSGRVGDLQFTNGSLPPLATFKLDAGTGFDLGLIGVFVAKAVGDSDSPNFFVRLRHRF